MKNFLILGLACVTLAASAQETETRNLSSFSGVRVSEGVSVYLKKGDKESAKVEVTGTDPSNVMTEVSGSYLKVHMKDGRYHSVNAKVYVTYKSIDKLSASSAGNVYAEESIKASSLEVGASSAGTIEVAVDAERVDASASSAGDLELKGKTKYLNVDASSAGEIDAYDLESEEVNAEASSGGSAKVNVTKGLTARASSGGGIRYRGNPDKSNTNTSSGGSVRKAN